MRGTWRGQRRPTWVRPPQRLFASFWPVFGPSLARVGGGRPGIRQAPGLLRRPFPMPPSLARTAWSPHALGREKRRHCHEPFEHAGRNPSGNFERMPATAPAHCIDPQQRTVGGAGGAGAVQGQCRGSAGAVQGQCSMPHRSPCLPTASGPAPPSRCTRAGNR